MGIDAFTKSQEGKYLSILLAGILTGYLLFPEKRIEEKITKEYEQKIVQIKQSNEKEVEKLKEDKKAVEKTFSSYKKQTEFKLEKLSSEIKELKSKQKTSYYKIVRPDGTIEIKKFTETDTEESTQVISSIKEEYSQKILELEQKWKEIHEKRVLDIKRDFSSKEEAYKKEIFRLEQQKITEVGKKRFGVEVGLSSDEEVYIHANYDLVGPIFLGGHIVNPTQISTVGLGIGLRF
jgi:hypothetical protein